MKQKEMGSKPRTVSSSMSLNDNLNFGGRDLHIQTENIQSEIPCIRTHVFSHGRIIHTTKFEFPTGMKELNDFNKIRDLMQTQHCEVIDKISRQQSKLSINTDSRQKHDDPKR